MDHKPELSEIEKRASVDGVVHDKDLVAGHDKAEADHYGHLSEEELVLEKKLRRKIDLVIMPTVILVYLMNYIDRNNYPAARLAGLEEDLNMDPQSNQFQVGLSVLFVGYVLMQVPSNMMLNWCGRPSWYIGFWTVAWGLVSALTSLVQTYGQIVACRFILGFVEAPFFPGILFYLSKWYTKKELNLRMAIFFSGSLIAGAFGNLIAAGILDGLAGARGLAAWRWLYIIEGAITIALGLAVIFILPDFPDTWKRLSPELKAVANRRLAIDAAEADVDVGGNMSHWTGAKLAFKDPKTYLLAFMYHCIVGGTGFQNLWVNPRADMPMVCAAVTNQPAPFERQFERDLNCLRDLSYGTFDIFPTLTATLTENRIYALLLVAPPYIFAVFYTYGHAMLSDRMQNRFYFYLYPLPIAIVGCLVFMFTDGFGPRYFSLFLLNFAFASFGTQFAWISNSIPRPPAKRTVALAFMNSIGNMASIWTPFTYFDSTYPYYRPALGIVIGLFVASAIGAVVLRWMMLRMNRELARLEDSDTLLTDKELAKLHKTAELENIDIATARQLQKGFRYII